MSAPIGAKYGRWTVDADGWLVRLRSKRDAAASLDLGAGFVLGRRVFTRSKGLADLLDAGEPIPARWWTRPDLCKGWPGEDWNTAD